MRGVTRRETKSYIHRLRQPLNRKTLSIFIIFFSALFVFQTLEISAVRANAKTCCGRSICLCKHAQNKPCPMKAKMSAPASEMQHAALMPCHRKAAPAKKVEIPEGAVSFSKAPCAKDNPKTLLPQYFKDYLSSLRAGEIKLRSTESRVVTSLTEFIPLSFSSSIEHPPRTF